MLLVQSVPHVVLSRQRLSGSPVYQVPVRPGPVLVDGGGKAHRHTCPYFLLSRRLQSEKWCQAHRCRGSCFRHVSARCGISAQVNLDMMACLVLSGGSNRSKWSSLTPYCLRQFVEVFGAADDAAVGSKS